MKLFIAGLSGLLGLNMALQSRWEHQVSGTYLNRPVHLERVNVSQVDLSSKLEVEYALKSINPDVILNAAAATDVDRCETDRSYAYTGNVKIACNLASVASSIGAIFVQISSDQLFDGCTPWMRENSVPSPLNYYGVTKAQGEQVVLDKCPDSLIVRTNFYGMGMPERTSFSDWILLGLEERRELGLFSDVFFNPIMINQLIDVCLDLAISNKKGIFHVMGRDRLSKYDFGIMLAEHFGHDKDSIKETSIEDVSLKASRPKEMSLAFSKVENELHIKMPTILDGFNELAALKHQGWGEKLANSIKSGRVL